MNPTSCTLILSIFISNSLHVSDNYVPIIRRTYCTYETLVFFILCGVKGNTHIEKLWKMGHIEMLEQVKFTIGQNIRDQKASIDKLFSFFNLSPRWCGCLTPLSGRFTPQKDTW